MGQLADQAESIAKLFDRIEQAYQNVEELEQECTKADAEIQRTREAAEQAGAAPVKVPSAPPVNAEALLAQAASIEVPPTDLGEELNAKFNEILTVFKQSTEELKIEYTKHRPAAERPAGEAPAKKTKGPDGMAVDNSEVQESVAADDAGSGFATLPVLRGLEGKQRREAVLAFRRHLRAQQSKQ